MKEVRFALLGFGGIAQSHKHGYDILKDEGFPVRLLTERILESALKHGKRITV